MNPSPLRRPSALVPIGMSLAALATVLAHIVLFGAAREADEGAAAHIWQLLMAGQLPVIVFFAFKWLPRAQTHAFRTCHSGRSGTRGAVSGLVAWPVTARG